MTQMGEYKEVYNYRLYKRRSRVTKEKLESQAGGPGRMGPQRSADDPRFIAHLWLVIERIHKIQASGSKHADPGKSELSNE